MSSAFLRLLHILKFTSDFIMEANNLNPDQTAPFWEQSDLGPYCLQYRLPKSTSRREEQMTIVVTGGNRDKCACSAIQWG